MIDAQMIAWRDEMVTDGRGWGAVVRVDGWERRGEERKNAHLS